MGQKNGNARELKHKGPSSRRREMVKERNSGEVGPGIGELKNNNRGVRR